ncbi:hypothetical protein CQY20_25580 [Mycolicibacterium agri]|uniref:DUF3592 domain-containing protein n=1 Tax=Mycolicibacterium agri TaxID=36811 RepID=A0A2A7MSG9_MYCAG|nr:hypothetical protein [Mycolicibacterium agri]PEG34457.1 hypothetical protein CQY20_25580 [Mycolicibacterium agri]GFG51933.1 hypothetical protein MAGR_33740 [Mycolicibacterium agri]
MTCELTRVDGTAPTWEDTPPHFSISEKGNRITASPLEAPNMLGFLIGVSFVLWAPAATAGTLYFHSASQGADVAWFWVGALILLYTFVPAVITDLTSDEARDRIGQRATANRIAAIPMIAGLGVGLAIAAVWVDGAVGAMIAAASVASSIAAAAVAVAALWGIRYTRKRHAWMAWLRRHGTRSPGVLREVKFLRRWGAGQPQFRVVVEYATAAGPRWVTANMTTTTRRVPKPGAAVVVTSQPHDSTAEPLIEFDYTREPEFDRDFTKYEQPSGN